MELGNRGRPSMRAVFTIDLPKVKAGFPEEREILELVRGFGWEPKRMEILTERDIRAMMVAQGTMTEEVPGPLQIGQSDEEEPPQGRPGESLLSVGASSEEGLQSHYKRLAVPLFADMPEVAAAEGHYVTFLGYISDDQTLFVITSMVPGQITFRLLHRELPRLQASTEKMLRKVLSSRLGDTHGWFSRGRPMHVSNPIITVYERKFDHVIVTGRAITNAFAETLRSNRKDVTLFLVPLLLVVPVIYLLLTHASGAPSISLGDILLRQGSTALLTTSLVSALGLLTTWREIKRHRLIEWTVAVDTRKKP